MYFISSNVAVFAIAAVLMAFAWVWGGTRGDLLPGFVPWMTFILVEVMFAFPQRGRGESLADARRRMRKAISSDRLTWACFAFFVLLMVPFVNETYPFLPWCPDPAAHLNVCLWFVPSLLAMLAAKHSLRRSGKRFLFEVLVWHGVALAIFGFVQLFTGARSPFWTDHARGFVFFATFGYPNMAGDYFAALTCLAIGLWRRRLVDAEMLDYRKCKPHKVFWARHYPLIAVAILYFAAINTLSRAAIMLSTGGAVVLFVFAGLARLHRLHKARRVRFAAMLLFSVVAVVTFALVFTPDEVSREIDTLKTTAVLDRMTGKTEYHSRVATELIGDYPAFGCGGWGYAYLSPSKVPEQAKRAKRYGWGAGSANVHNDYLQFLCEHGIVGFLLLVLIVILAVRPAAQRWKSMARMIQFSRHTGLPWPKGFFCFPPTGIAIYTSAIITLIHAFGDCPLRSPAVLSLFFVQLVLVDGYLPRVEE